MQSLDGNASAGYYTQISTEIVWEEKSVTQSLVTNDEWNVTSPSVSNDTAVEFNVSHMVLTSLALLLINLAVIIGNILVLLAVYFERALRTVTNYFIVNLAIADLLLGTLVLPFSSAFEVIHYWPFGDVFCDIWAAVDVLCCTASINSLCCISVDRYIGVTRPLKHRLIMTPKRAIAINIFVWFISFGIAVGPLFGWRPVKTSQLECPLSDSVGYVFFSVAGSFYIPSAVIIVLYFRIYRAVSHETKSIQNKARKRQNGDLDNGRIILRIHVGNNLQSSGKCSIRSHDYSSSTSRSRNLSQRTATFNREKKVAKTLGIVVSVFIICWLPFFFLLPLSKFSLSFLSVHCQLYIMRLKHKIYHLCCSTTYSLFSRRTLYPRFNLRPYTDVCPFLSNQRPIIDLIQVPPLLVCEVPKHILRQLANKPYSSAPSASKCIY